MHRELVAIVVDDYDTAIRFFVDALGFELVEDPPSLSSGGRAKRLGRRSPAWSRLGRLASPS